MTTNRKTLRSGAFTLIEMTLALSMTLTIAAVLLVLLQQQLSFGQALGKFSFLRDEAPQVNTLLTSLTSRADSYRIFTDLDSAKSFSNAVRSGGKALRLRFRKPDGTTQDGIISFEERNGSKELNYYLKDGNTTAWSSTPRWTVSSQPENIVFDNNFGILLVTITGPNGDEITYAGNPE
ncbi:hypothetical protein VSU19_14305 [Verrucomicrobiales bacterium BCK34]|nr:hypothetical protein [Verrucomicrobiales bacterium BCK34]